MNERNQFLQRKSAIYARVCTGTQGEKEISLQEQERMAKARIESKGWLYVKTYKDDGYTGRDMDRPALQELLKDIERGELEAVFIYKLDRLSRKQRDIIDIIENHLLKKDVALISLHEELDTSTSWGRTMISVLVAFNQLESENIVVRTSMGREAKARAGGYAGGKPPIGYQAVNGKLVIVPHEAEIVRLVFKMRSEGASYVAIAAELNARGYTTKSGKKFLHSAVQTILNNESTYRGYYKYGKERSIEGAHEPILKDGEFSDSIYLKG